jgi:hypothetical protein
MLAAAITDDVPSEPSLRLLPSVAGREIPFVHVLISTYDAEPNGGAATLWIMRTEGGRMLICRLR